LSQHNKPLPITGFRAAFMKVVVVLIGLALLLFVYYYIRYDFFAKDLYTSRTVGKLAGLGLLLAVGIPWYWFKGRRRSGRN
jgi:hypothetical protein